MLLIANLCFKNKYKLSIHILMVIYLIIGLYGLYDQFLWLGLIKKFVAFGALSGGIVAGLNHAMHKMDGGEGSKKAI
mgnify:CR=1 FL=1